MQGFNEFWLGDSVLNFLALHKDLMQTVMLDGTSVFVAAVPATGALIACCCSQEHPSLLKPLQVILSTTFCGGWSMAAMCFTGHVFHNVHPKIIVVMAGTTDLLSTVPNLNATTGPKSTAQWSSPPSCLMAGQ